MSLIGSAEAAPRLKEVEFIGGQSKSDAFEQVKNVGVLTLFQAKI